MRILIATNTYPSHLNGQAVFVGSLAEGMAENGHQVSVLVPGIDRVGNEEQNGVEIISTPAIDLRFIHKEFFIAWRYQKIVRKAFDEQKPEIVHLQDPAPLSKAVMKEARKRGIPVMCTHHTGPAVWAPYLSEKFTFLFQIAVPMIWDWVLRFLNQADMVTVPSRASVKMLIQRGLNVPIKPISCGVELDQFRSVRPEQIRHIKQQYRFNNRKKHLLYVGRIDEEKRVDVLLQGMAKSKDPNVELILAGGGAAEESMHNLSKMLKISEKIRFLGKVRRTEIPALYAACDVFIMPGDVESLSIATLEAMSCGKPVIAANAMALPELVSVGHNGLLFKPRNSVDLGQKIDQLCTMRKCWPKMGANSLERVQEHDLKLTIKQYQTLYQQMISHGPSKPHSVVQKRLSKTVVHPFSMLFILISLIGLLSADYIRIVPAFLMSFEETKLTAAQIIHLISILDELKNAFLLI
jgi:1,2-diacylglycerol 3-alpha-glucosyltransferase